MTTATTDMRSQASTRQQPSIAAPPSPSDMQGFEPCYLALLRSLPFAKLRWDQRRDPAMVLSAFLESWNQLTTAATTNLHRMIQGTCIASADDRTQAKLIDIDALATQDTERLLRHAPVLPNDSDRILSDVRRVEGANAFALCGQALGRQAAHVIRRYWYALEQLRECGLAGSVHCGNRVCDFTHVRTVLTDVERDRTEQSSEQTRTKNGVFINRKIHITALRSEATVETLTSLWSHRHRLAYPEWHPAPARDLPLPDRIKAHQACIPFFMKPTYITGTLIDVTVEQEALGSRKDCVVETTQRTRIERQLNRQNLVRAGVIAGTAALTIAALPFIAIGAVAAAVHADPALVVGNGRYVLSGWLPEELPLDRRYYLQRT